MSAGYVPSWKLYGENLFPSSFVLWREFISSQLQVEKEMTTHCSTLAWKISWTEEPRQVTVHGGITKKSGMTEHTRAHTSAGLGSVSSMAVSWDRPHP